MGSIIRVASILKMLEQEPNDVFLNYALAMEYISNNQLIQSETQLNKVLSINSEYLPCYYQLGQLQEKLGENNLAISYYQKGIELAKNQNNTKALGELSEAIWLLED